MDKKLLQKVRIGILILIGGTLLFSREKKEKISKKWTKEAINKVLSPFLDKINYWSKYWSNPNHKLIYKTKNLESTYYIPRYKIHPDWIKAIIMVESEANPYLLGDRLYGGSYGLMQVLLSTIRKYYGFNGNPVNLFDPDTNLYWGIKEFAIQLHHYFGNVKKAIFAYNTGTGNWSYKGNRYYTKWRAFLDRIRGEY